MIPKLELLESRLTPSGGTGEEYGYEEEYEYGYEEEYQPAPAPLGSETRVDVCAVCDCVQNVREQRGFEPSLELLTMTNKEISLEKAKLKRDWLKSCFERVNDSKTFSIAEIEEASYLYRLAELEVLEAKNNLEGQAPRDPNFGL